MSLLDDVLRWSADLKTWQSDALRRLFLQGNLTDQDINELLAMVKEIHGGGPPTGNRALPLQEEHISGAGSGATVQLLRMSNLVHVNAFPEGRSLGFEPTGLFVLFGENGAGKSGYARVLKNCCSARRRDPVQPNAFGAETGESRIPSADIEVLVEGRSKTVSWRQGESGDPDLRMVSVYDSVCAKDYLETEGEPNFHPYGLGHLNQLVSAQREMQRIITAERDAITVNASVFTPLKGNTSVGGQIEKLGSNTDLDLIRQLGSLSEVEVRRVAFLDEALRDLDPEPRAQGLERLASRLETIAGQAQIAQRYVSDAAILKLKGLHETKCDADAAYEIAQRRLRGEGIPGCADDLLPGTGNAVWQTLYRAAEAYSAQFAYPDHDFPHTGPGAKCVLCQAEFGPEARVRMDRFAEFVAQQASKAALEAASALTKAMQVIEAAVLTPIDAPTLEDLISVAPEVHSIAVATQDAWDARRRWMVNAVANNGWGELEPSLPPGDSLDSLLKVLQVRLRNDASTLRKSVDPMVREGLEIEQRELKARQALGPMIPSIEVHVANCIKRESLDRCISALGTGAISVKMTNLARTYITTELAAKTNQELSLLGYRRRVRPFLTGRTDSGITKMTLQIEGTTVGARYVLSEGEQRAMALALFLAEAGSQNHRSAIVFDDPSTSLDHRHRFHMAERLVELSKDRQVLIFTHDAVFLAEVLHALRKARRKACFKSIGWDESAPGYVEDGLTWETQDTKNRLDGLKQAATAIRAMSGDYLSERSAQEVTKTYGKLRGTVERAIREVVLNHTIRPYSDEVAVERLGAVAGYSEEEFGELWDVYERACRVTDSHDTPPERQISIPDPDTLFADIDRISSLIDRASARRSAFQRKRDPIIQARKDVVKDVTS